MFYSYLNLDNKKKVELYGMTIIANTRNTTGRYLPTLLSKWNNHGKPEMVWAFALWYVENVTPPIFSSTRSLPIHSIYSLDTSKPSLEYKKLIADGFDNFESNLVIGLCYYNLEKYREAYTYLNKAAEMKKDNPNMNCLFYLGMTCKKISETD